MTSAPNSRRPECDLKSEVIGAFSLEAVINTGSLELLLDHLERTHPEDPS